MTRSLVALGMLLASSDAYAFAMGSTAGISAGDPWSSIDFTDFDFVPDASTGGFLPSLDLHPGPVHLQIHLLEFTEALISNEELFLGANMYFDSVSKPLGGGAWLGVVQPGFGVDLYGDPFAIAVTGQARLGPEINGDAGFGLYVVPAAGLLIDDGDAYWLAGGSVQISAWFGT